MAVPGQVTGLAVASGTNELVLTWVAATGTVVKYNVYVGTVIIGTTADNVLTYTDTGLADGETVAYTVAAENDDGVGTASSEVSGTTWDLSAVEVNPLHYATEAIRTSVFELTGQNQYTLSIPSNHTVLGIVARFTDGTELLGTMNIVTNKTAQTIKVYEAGVQSVLPVSITAIVFWK